MEFSRKTNKNIFNIFSILIAFITLYNTANKFLRGVGLASIIILLGLSSLILFKYYLNSKKANIKIVGGYLLAIMIFGFGTILNFEVRGFIILAQLFLLLNFFFLFTNIRYELGYINISILIGVLTLYIGIFYVGILSPGYVHGYDYKSIYGNPNYLGMASLLFLFISWILYRCTNRKFLRIYICAYGYMVYLSGARASLLALTVSIITLMSIKFISKNKHRWRSSYILLIILMIIGVIAYTYLPYTKAGVELNSAIRNISGKNFFSGRQLIWEEAWILIKENPFFGYGTGTLMFELTLSRVPSHNLYIEVVIQNGLVGVSLLLIFLGGIWKKYYQGIQDKVVKLSSCFLVGILCLNLFEATLTQSSMSIAIMEWFVLAVGVSRAKANNNTK